MTSFLLLSTCTAEDSDSDSSAIEDCDVRLSEDDEKEYVEKDEDLELGRELSDEAGSGDDGGEKSLGMRMAEKLNFSRVGVGEIMSGAHFIMAKSSSASSLWSSSRMRCARVCRRVGCVGAFCLWREEACPSLLIGTCVRGRLCVGLTGTRSLSSSQIVMVGSVDPCTRM